MLVSQQEAWEAIQCDSSIDQRLFSLLLTRQGCEQKSNMLASHLEPFHLNHRSAGYLGSLGETLRQYTEHVSWAETSHSANRSWGQ